MPAIDMPVNLSQWRAVDSVDLAGDDLGEFIADLEQREAAHSFAAAWDAQSAGREPDQGDLDGAGLLKHASELTSDELHERVQLERAQWAADRWDTSI
jgi:hypothetical protein